jgi:hypothetical protein
MEESLLQRQTCRKGAKQAYTKHLDMCTAPAQTRINLRKTLNLGWDQLLELPFQ